MNYLEKRGFIACAGTALGIRRFEAAMLLALVEAKGQPMTFEQLMHSGELINQNIGWDSVKCGMARLRGALNDVGVLSVELFSHSGSYRLPEKDVPGIMAVVTDGKL